MMIRKYKIGNFTVEINSRSDFQDVEPFSRFLYDGEQTDYFVNVGFSTDLPQKIENPHYVSSDKVYDYKDGALRCFCKSRDNSGSFYACRTVDGNQINIDIDENFREMLWTRVIFSLMGIEKLVAENNGCILHSSVIASDGGAIIFAGPCSIGKSTQANLWRKYAGAEVINGDKAMIFEKDGVHYASGIPFSGSSKDCLNKELPLKAIIILGQSNCNKARRLGSDEAFLELYKNCYPVPYSRELTGRLIDFVQKLSQNVPIYQYACLADESAVRYLEKEL